MSESLADADLSTLVEAWLLPDEAAELLGVPTSKVLTMVKNHELAAAVPRPKAGLQVPAGFIDGHEVVKGLGGLLTVLHDTGFDDREAIAWIHLDQDFPGRGIDALRENRGREVKRRAQALGF